MVCISIWEDTQLDSTVRPSRTTAAAVSSQEDSMARMFIKSTTFHENYSYKAVTSCRARAESLPYSFSPNSRVMMTASSRGCW